MRRQKKITPQQAMQSKVQLNSLKMEAQLNDMAKYIKEKKWIPKPQVVVKNVYFEESDESPTKTKKEKGLKRKKSKTRKAEQEKIE